MRATNQEITSLLRSVAAAYTIKKVGNIFQVRAYEGAADSVEKSTSEIQDLWKEGRLDQVPGLGKILQGYLDELFKNGKVKHFEEVKQGIKPIVFELLNIPGVGPKTAQELANLGIKSFDQLESQIKSGELVEKGFSAKIAEKMALGLMELKNRSGRMMLPFASLLSTKILEYMNDCPDLVRIEPLGSLRRKLATIGDLDFAASSTSPQKVVDYFVKMPWVARILDQGETKASVILNSNIQVDLLVGDPESYGALLQHFTGSKQHNIHLRTLAEAKGYSLSEYGLKQLKSGQIKAIKTEEELYKLLDMDTPAPEIREDTGEIEAAQSHKLPKLLDLTAIKGDIHLHSNFPIAHPSHGPGANPIKEIVNKARELGYEYIGVSDHPPGHNLVSKSGMIKNLSERSKEIEQIKSSERGIKILNGLEIDILPDGSLSVPDEFLETLDYCIAGVHSSHRMGKEEMTNRILKALENPNVDIISHPTGRLINERESYQAEWEEIFKYAAKKNKLLEINGFPNRLDLRDDLVRLALSFGVRFIISSDAHEVSQMENMPYGVDVARRGWAEAKDIVNTWEWQKFAKWFNIKI